VDVSAARQMASAKIVLVLADISGYTRFARLHRTSQAHAEHIVCELLDEVIGATEHPLELHQLLGDAAVFFARSDGSPAMARDVFGQVRRFSDAFRVRAQDLTGACSLCVCDACRGAGRLELKVIVHHADVVETELRGIPKFAGEDMIVAHRLMKNSVSAGDYVLVTDSFQDLLGDAGGTPERRREHCEGVGEVGVAVYYPDGVDTPPPPAPLTTRLATTARMEAYAVRRLVTRKPKRPSRAPPDASTRLDVLSSAG
jgi:Protein of unknown function (DUF2652)